MGKKNKGDDSANAGNAAAAAAAARKGPDGCILFSSSDAVLDAVRKQVDLPHITKPWSRDAWERAKPWVLEQRQKLEGMGWAGVDGQRTELYVLKKNAPHGADTEDGFLYLRIPKKFIDFNRSGKDDGAGAEEADGGAADEDGSGKKKTKRVSKKKENAPSYELTHPEIWKLRIDGDSEDSDREPTVLLDVVEPLENIFYLLMVLQPGLARLSASRKDVIQRGTKVSDTRDDTDVPTIRHRAQVAASESYVRVLPPSFWMKRNEGELRKILTDGTYDATAKAAEDDRRSAERNVKDVKEKTWEERLKVEELSVKDKKKAGAAGGGKAQQQQQQQAQTEVAAAA